MGRNRLSMLRLMACRCSMIARMSRTRSCHVAPCRIRQLAGRGGDRGGIGLEAEQARPDLVMQLQGGAPPLVVLRGDQPLVQSQVLGARRVERLRERIEPVGDRGELLRLRPRQPHLVVAPLEIGEAAREPGERIEHASEQKIEDRDDRDVDRNAERRRGQGVSPDLGDLVAAARR